MAAAIGAMAGTLYALTAARNIVLGDSAEFVTTAITLSVAHPSGYPLLTLLGHTMAALPIGPLAARVNLLSAACGAVTAAILQIEPMSKDVTVAAIADDNDRLLRRYRIPPPVIGRHANFDPYILRDYATPARLVGFRFMAASLRPQAAVWFRRALDIDPDFAEARSDLARATAPGR